MSTDNKFNELMKTIEEYLNVLRKLDYKVYEEAKKCVNKMDLNCIMDLISKISSGLDHNTSDVDELYDLVYVYPIKHFVSFKIVAERYIEYLKLFGVNIKCVDEHDLSYRYDKPTILHPLMFIYFNNRFLPKAPGLVAFEVAETSRISDVAVHLFNKMDLVVVPSTYSAETVRRSGVNVPVEVIPHCLGHRWFRKKKPYSHMRRELLELNSKRSDNTVYVLFNLWHSGARKGADIFYLALKRLQREYPNVVVVIKRVDILDPYLGLLKHLKHVELSGRWSEDDMIDLYDTVDIVVLTSRAGGFEMTGLEALFRGKITVVPDAGCFKEYSKYAVTYKAYEKGLPYDEPNYIHTGYGWEPSAYHLYEVLADIVDNIDRYRERFGRQVDSVRSEFSCLNVVSKLYNVFKKYNIIQ